MARQTVGPDGLYYVRQIVVSAREEGGGLMMMCLEAGFGSRSEREERGDLGWRFGDCRRSSSASGVVRAKKRLTAMAEEKQKKVKGWQPDAQINTTRKPTRHPLGTEIILWESQLRPLCR
jgi:hypothetical protein